MSASVPTHTGECPGAGMTALATIIDAAIGTAFIDAKIALIEREALRDRIINRLMDAGIRFEEASRIAREEIEEKSA